MKRTLILLVLAALLTACGTPVKPMPTSPPTPLIAFSSERDGNAEIYVMPAPGPQAQVNSAPPESGTGGTGLTRLTDNPAYDLFPAGRPTVPASPSIPTATATTRSTSCLYLGRSPR